MKEGDAGEGEQRVRDVWGEKVDRGSSGETGGWEMGTEKG